MFHLARRMFLVVGVALVAHAAAAAPQASLYACSALAGSYSDHGDVSGNVPEIRQHLSRVLAQLLKQSPFPLVQKGIATIAETRLRFTAQNELSVSAHFPDGTVVQFEGADPEGFTCQDGTLRVTVEMSGHSEGQTTRSTERFAFARDSSGGLRMEYARERASSYMFIPSAASEQGNVLFPAR